MTSTSMPARASSSLAFRHLLTFIVLAVTIALGVVAGHAGSSSVTGSAVQQSAPFVATTAAESPLSGCAFGGHAHHADEASCSVVAVPATTHPTGDRPLHQVAPRTTPLSTVAVGEPGRRDDRPISLTELSISRT